MAYKMDEALIGVTELYSTQANEKNDCFIKAISMTTKIPYMKVWEAAARQGRRRRSGTSLRIGETILNIYKFLVEKVVPDMNDKAFVGAGKYLLSRHFNEMNAEYFVKKYGDAFIAFSKGHAIPVINGIAHDWSYSRSLRITEIWMIKKAG